MLTCALAAVARSQSCDGALVDELTARALLSVAEEVIAALQR